MAAIVPKAFAQMQREYSEEVQRLAELAFRRYCREYGVRLYIAGTRKPCLDTHNPQLPIWTRLTVATAEEIDAREELHAVNGEALSPSWTLERLQGRIRELLNSEPLYIFAD